MLRSLALASSLALLVAGEAPVPTAAVYTIVDGQKLNIYLAAQDADTPVGSLRFGSIASARIIPPTSQNQMTIEEDLRALAERLIDASDADAAQQCEHLIRNYDPCISCSVHFLKFSRSRT